MGNEPKAYACHFCGRPIKPWDMYQNHRHQHLSAHVDCLNMRINAVRIVLMRAGLVGSERAVHEVELADLQTMWHFPMVQS